MTDSPMGRPKEIPMTAVDTTHPTPKPVLVFTSWEEEAVYARVCRKRAVGMSADDLVIRLTYCDRAIEVGKKESDIRNAIARLIVNNWIEQRGDLLFRTTFERAIVCRFL